MSYTILDSLYGASATSVTLVQDGVIDTDSYKLTVRAGEITKVNGIKNWRTSSSIPDSVKTAIDNMSLTTEGVFNVFASNEGTMLNEDAFEDLTKVLREDSDSIEVGKGWYSEDTTVLTLNVYTTKFSLKPVLFSNKIPMSISTLETPQSKANFYSKGTIGHLQLELQIATSDPNYQAKFIYNTRDAYGSWYSNKQNLYVVPNVSVTDTTMIQ